MFDLGLLTVPLLSLFIVFGFVVVTDVNMIAFDVTGVPKMALDMGFDANNVRDTIMHKINVISNVAETSRGVTYSTIGDMRFQSLKNISETLGIQKGVLAAQGFLGLVPYRLKGKMMQEGNVLYLVITGFSSDAGYFNLTLQSDKLIFNSTQTIKGQVGRLDNTQDTDHNNTKLTTANAEIEISSLLAKAAEAIVDRIDPYLLARYYYILESPDAIFTKTIPQLMHSMTVLPMRQRVWPLLLWGRTCESQGKLDKAVEIYKAAIVLDPKFPFAYLRLGEVLAKSGQHQEAIALYKKAIYNSRFYPQYPVAMSAAYVLWGDSLIVLKHLNQAEAILRIGVNRHYVGNECSTANALSHNALGRFLMNYKHNYTEAEYYLRQAVYTDDNPVYYASLQKILAKRIPGYGDYVKKTQNDPQAVKISGGLIGTPPSIHSIPEY